MTFKKNHKLGFLPENDIPLDRLPLSIKLKLGIRDKVRSIPDWQDRLRAMIEQWVESELDLDERI